jgi:hypothetical protein
MSIYTPTQNATPRTVHVQRGDGVPGEFHPGRSTPAIPSRGKAEVDPGPSKATENPNAPDGPKPDGTSHTKKYVPGTPPYKS